MMRRPSKAAALKIRELFFPGSFVEDERTNQRGTVIVPGPKALAEMPDDHSVFIHWAHNNRESWVDATRLRQIYQL